MPTYTLPKEKKRKDVKAGEAAVDSPDEYQRRVSFPVNTKILESVTIGDVVKVTLLGEVVDASKHDSTDHKSRNISVKMSSVEVYPESEEEAEKGFQKGFKRGPKH